jgi:CubicO group peptidase (beta-lactamase class C family)
MTKTARPMAFATAVVAAAVISAPAQAQKPLPGMEKVPLPLTWSQKEQLERYPAMEKVYATNTIKKGTKVLELPAGKAVNPKVKYKGKTSTLDAFMKAQRITGVIAVKDGKVISEHYALGQKADDRWTSFSVAKSMTSTLIGAAIKDKWIRSEYDQLTLYIPELKGSAYDGVSLRQVMTMTSGVKWNEDYTDPKSDVAQSSMQKYDGQTDPLILYMKKLPREAPPGTKFVYKTGETDLAGIALSRALIGKTMAQYASEKIWAPFGMEKDGLWITDLAGLERGGCCMSMTLRDYARMGLFMLGGGKVNGQDILPDGWIDAATTNQLPKTAKDDKGKPQSYGYFWWTETPPNYRASGIYGQGIYIFPEENLVIAMNGATAKASGPSVGEPKQAIVDAIRAAANGK